MKKYAALLAVVLLVVSFASISAQEKEVQKAPACKGAKLDSETKVKVEKLKLQYELDMVDIDAEKEQLHKALMEELAKEDASTKTIDKLSKSLNANHGKMLSLKMDYLLKVKKVVPPEHFNAFITKGHKGQSCAPGCKKPCCATKSTGCKGSSKCPMAGTEGHKCTDACKTGSHCKTPCNVNVKK